MKRLLLTSSMALALLSMSSAHAAGKGQLDPKFSTDGMAETTFDIGGDLNDNIGAQVVGLGGSTYLIGPVSVAANPNVSIIGVAKFQHDGKLDATYGDGGRALLTLPTGSLTTLDMDGTMTSDGKLLIAATANIANARAGMVCRMDTVGKIDEAFGDPSTPGCVRVKSPGPNGKFDSVVRSIVTQPGGSIFLGGEFLNPQGAGSAGFAALTKDGKGPLTSFGQNGFVHLSAAFILRKIELTPDNGLIGLGAKSLNSLEQIFVAKVKRSNGVGFSDFGNAGIVSLTLDTINDGSQQAVNLDVANDGSAFIVGQSGPADVVRSFVAKLTLMGKLDPTFNTKGFVEFEEKSVLMRFLTDVEAMTDGVVLSGRVQVAPQVFQWNVLKLKNTGPVDTTFANLGFLTIPLSDSAKNVDTQGRRIVVSGSSTGSQELPADKDFHIARLDHGQKVSFQVLPSGGANGTISPATAVMVPDSDVAEFTVTPNVGFRIGSVSNSCGASGELIGTRYRTPPITNGCLVIATFVKLP